MKYLSLCAGIEAASVAWHHMGWQPTAFSEIEPFPIAVLAHHYPNTPNWGDMTKYKEWPDADVNVLVGGTPCQSFLVAGLRKGLDDPRGNLMLTYLAIADRYRPQWLVWENVPGVLSSNGGRDFASLLRGMGELGYGFAYRVLDAQYLGVAQRRRRVFVVGCLGSWQRAAAVLFEQHSLSGHPAPSRKAREETANCLGASPAGGGASNIHKGQGNIVGTLTAGMGQNKMGAPEVDAGLYIPVAQPISFGAQMSNPQTDVNMVQTLQTKNPMAIAFSRNDDGGDATQDLAPTMRVAGRAGGMLGVAQPIAFAQNTRDEVRLIGGDGQIVGALAAESGMKQTSYVALPVPFVTTQFGEIAGSLTARHDSSPCADRGMNVVAVAQPVAFQPRIGRNGRGYMGDIVNALQAQSGQSGKGDAAPCVAFDTTQLTSPSNYSNSQPGDPCHPLAAGAHPPALATAMQVRRLTPVECERLQGFPDNYTNIPWRKKPESPDGPRYKALGNSMAVPVMRWIGERIQAVEDIK